MMTFLLIALGAVLVVEGLVYALAPSFVEHMLRELHNIPPSVRRLVGVLMLVIGLIVLRIAY